MNYCHIQNVDESETLCQAKGARHESTLLFYLYDIFEKENLSYSYRGGTEVGGGGLTTERHKGIFGGDANYILIC